MMRKNKIGRNEPCPCGSGIKYKKCCLMNPDSNSGSYGLRPRRPQKTKTLNVRDLFNKSIDELTPFLGAFELDFLDIRDYKYGLREHNGGFYFCARDKSYYHYERLEDCAIFIDKEGVISSGGSESDALRATSLLCLLIQELYFDHEAYVLIKALRNAYDTDFEKVECTGLALAHPDFSFSKQNKSKQIKTKKYKVINDWDLQSWFFSLLFSHAEVEENQKLYKTTKMGSLFFLFSDGQALSFYDLPSHPYKYIAEEQFAEVLKSFDVPKEALDQYKNVKWLSSWSDTGDEAKTLFSCVAGDLKNKFPIHIAKTFNQGLVINTDVKINGVKPPEKANSLKLQMPHDKKKGELHIELDTQEHSQELSRKDFFWNDKERVIELTPFSSLTSQVSEKLRHLPGNHCYRSFTKDKKDKFSIDNHPSPKDVLKQLKKLGSDVFSALPEEQSAPVYTVCGLKSQNLKRVEFNLLLKRDEEFDYQESVRAERLPITVANFLKSFAFGLSGFFGKEAVKLACKHGQYRNNEIRLYKHVALTRLLTLETLNLVADQTRTDSKKKLKEEIETKVSHLISRILNKNETELSNSYTELESNYVTKKFISNLNKFTNALFNFSNEKMTYLTGESILELETGKHFETIIHFTVQKLNQGLNSSEMLKARSKGFSWSAESNDEASAILSLEFPTPVSLIELREFERVLVDGKPVETLNETDFNSRLGVVGQKRGNDWFELNPVYFFRGKEISFDQAQNFMSGDLVEFKGRFYQIDPSLLPSFKSLKRFWSKITQSGKGAVPFSQQKSLEIKMERSKILELLALKRQGVSIEGDQSWNEVSENFDRLDEDHEKRTETLKKSLKTFNGKLKPFQQQGVNWLYTLCDLGLGGVLSDDMGLGKTVQSLALVHSLKSIKGRRLNLVVVPTSLTYNWNREAAKFSPDLKVCLFQGNLKQDYATEWLSDNEHMPDLVVATYGLVLEHQDFFCDFQWGLVLFDEAQNLKNIKSLRRQAVQKLKAQNKIALTGTPIENHYGELFSIVDLCVQGALGPYKEFMETFGSVAKDKSTMDGLVDEILFLKEKVRPLVLRRTKEMVLNDLPQKQESIVSLEFNNKQEKLYKKTAIAWNDQVQNMIEEKGESGAQLKMLTALLRLRQICSCPMVLEGVSKQISSPKFEVITDKAKELTDNGESLILFTNFIKTLEVLEEQFKLLGIKALSICGRDSKVKRENTLKEFDDSKEASVLLMTLKTGGVGLNLTKANYVFHVEPWWNPAAENQGTDRVHRMGQKRSVQVYRYIMKNSVEEKIQDLKKQKQKAFDMMFEEDVEGLKKSVTLRKSKLTREDFSRLLS